MMQTILIYLGVLAGLLALFAYFLRRLYNAGEVVNDNVCPYLRRAHEEQEDWRRKRVRHDDLYVSVNPASVPCTPDMYGEIVSPQQTTDTTELDVKQKYHMRKNKGC